MNYSQARSAIESGDVILFAGRGFWSRIIQARTRSRVSHCGMAVWIGDRLAVLEAHERCGVRLHPLSDYVAGGVELYWFALDDPSIRRGDVLRHAFAQWGRRYAPWWQFLRSWGLAGRRLARAIGLPVDCDPQRWFCSEYLIANLQAGAAAGHAVHRAISAETSPGDLVFLSCLRNRGRLENDG